jgi:ferrochelatase
MRHWHPYVRKSVAEIAAAGLRRGVALCLAPQYSRMSIGAYFRSLDEALAALPAGTVPELARVPSWGDHPLFLDAVAETLEAALRRLDGGPVHVLFTAHSLPARIVAAGDPYDAELRATAAAVAERAAARLGRPLDWTFCYQSAAAGAVDWLGPSIEDEIPRLAAAGHRRLLACPVGFVADHVEVLYDLDVEARRLAEAHGAQLHRTDSLNTSPTFIAALADVVRGALR